MKMYEMYSLIDFNKQKSFNSFNLPLVIFVNHIRSRANKMCEREMINEFKADLIHSCLTFWIKVNFIPAQ